MAGVVQFISRYRDETDYCVSGQRVHLYDDSTVRNATPEQIEALELHLIYSYSDYLFWHHAQRIKYGIEWPTLEPFGYTLPLRVV